MTDSGPMSEHICVEALLTVSVVSVEALLAPFVDAAICVDTLFVVSVEELDATNHDLKVGVEIVSASLSASRDKLFSLRESTMEDSLIQKRLK